MGSGQIIAKKNSTRTCQFQNQREHKMSKMLPSFAAFLTLCILLFTPVVGHAASPEDQVKAAYAAFNAAFNNSDAKAVAGMYVADAVILPPSHDVIKGPAIEKFFA